MTSVQRNAAKLFFFAWLDLARAEFVLQRDVHETAGRSRPAARTRRAGAIGFGTQRSTVGDREISEAADAAAEDDFGTPLVDPEPSTTVLPV